MCDDARFIEILCPMCSRCFLTNVVWSLRTGHLEGRCVLCNHHVTAVVEVRIAPPTSPSRPQPAEKGKEDLPQQSFNSGSDLSLF